MGDIVLNTPQTIENPTRYVPVTTQAARVRLSDFRLDLTGINAAIEWVDAGGGVIRSVRVHVTGAAFDAFQAQTIPQGAVGLRLDAVLERAVRNAIKAHLALDGTVA